MTISDDEIKELTSHCFNYFRAYIFLMGIVSPTLWIIGHIVPVHAKDTKFKNERGVSVTSIEWKRI